MRKNFILFISVSCLILILSGCPSTRGNSGRFQSYTFQPVEAAWIRNGEPIIFEDETWYPSDDVESLKDSEVFFLGEYRGTQFFADKIDVRPYNRLYTKFGKNRFRFFKKRERSEE